MYDLPNIIDIERFSSLTKLFRVTAYVCRFVKKLRDRLKNKEETNKQMLGPCAKEEINNKMLGPCAEDTITVEDVNKAKIMWIRESQKELKGHKKFDDWVKQFNIFSDDDSVLRCGGRLQNAPLPYSTKHPVLLTNETYFTRLVIINAHKNVGHNGCRETLTDVRRSFWIPKGRSTVKKVIHECRTCKFHEAKTLKYPLPPPLPEKRVQEVHPFTVIGIDYAGPVFVKNDFNDSSEMVKCWIVVITCANTRVD